MKQYATAILVTLLSGCEGSEGESARLVAAIRGDSDATTPATPIRQPPPVRLYGLDGVVHQTGDVITGEAALRALVITNGLVDVSYERGVYEPNPAYLGDPAAHHLFLNATATTPRRRAFYWEHGDWPGMGVGFATTAAKATVIHANDGAVEVAFSWPDHRLDTAYLTRRGISILAPDTYEPLYRRSALDLPNFDPDQHLALFRSIHVVKVVRVERGLPGYYVGWHTDPRLGPPMSRLEIGSPLNNTTDQGEREIGTGLGVGVAWSSNPAAGVAHFPEWGQRPVWAEAEAQIGQGIAWRHWWAGIDDSLVVPEPAMRTQAPGFPNEQHVGPWYVADIPTWAGLSGVARVVAMQRPQMAAVYQFYPTSSGANVINTVNEWPGPDGRPLKFQVFIGVLAHDVVDRLAEPTPTLRQEVDQLVRSLDWPN